jgi:hypothetical protein
MLGTTANAGLHVPPVSGMPFKLSNRSTGDALVQLLKLPLLPYIAGIIVTTTFEAVSEHPV